MEVASLEWMTTSNTVRTAVIRLRRTFDEMRGIERERLLEFLHVKHDADGSTTNKQQPLCIQPFKLATNLPRSTDSLKIQQERLRVKFFLGILQRLACEGSSGSGESMRVHQKGHCNGRNGNSLNNFDTDKLTEYHETWNFLANFTADILLPLKQNPLQLCCVFARSFYHHQQILIDHALIKSPWLSYSRSFSDQHF